MSIIVAGDLVPCNNDIELFENADVEKLMGKELYNYWISSEYRLFNLEAPITNSNKKILKNGPNLKISNKCMSGIKKLNPSIICLSNNHILDYGLNGLKDTIYELKKYNIDYIGIENTSKGSMRYKIIEIDNKQVAIYNTCENEFSTATDSTPGAFRYDEGEIIKDLLKLKSIVDYIIIIYHGGKEYYRYPSPLLQKRCRLLCDFGANVVICQHSHCIGCMEKYNDCNIIYGQGNFIFNNGDNEFWNSSLLINISFKNKVEIEMMPLVKCTTGVMLPSNDKAEKILKEFRIRSKEIEKIDFVKTKYDEYSKKMINNYLIAMHGNNRLFKYILKISNYKLLYFLYNKEKLLKIQNYIMCEAHNELFINGLELIRKENNNEK